MKRKKSFVRRDCAGIDVAGYVVKVLRGLGERKRYFYWE
jgi:hypothetical protein